MREVMYVWTCDRCGVDAATVHDVPPTAWMLLERADFPPPRGTYLFCDECRASFTNWRKRTDGVAS